MSKVTEKQIKQLKSKSIVPPLIFLLLSVLLGAILVAVTLIATFAYLVQNRYVEKSIEASSIQNSVDAYLEEGYDFDRIFRILQRNEHKPLAICVYDEDNNITASYGDELSYVQHSLFTEGVNIRLFSDENDKHIGLVNNTGINTVNVDIKKLWNNFHNVMRNTDEEADLFDGMSSEIYSYEVWIAKTLESDNQVMYLKYNQSIYSNDMLFVLITLIISGSIFFILLLVYITNVISNISSQRYLLKLLLHDNLTGGNNMLAFRTEATKRIAGNLKKEYAIVDFSLMKYQSYSTLYGTAEAEKLLSAMETALCKCLSKADLHARINDGDYILLLRNNAKKNQENTIVNRVDNIMCELPNLLRTPLSKSGSAIKDLSNIKFSAGIYNINPGVSKEFRERRLKKNINIDQLYIKAGIAKAVLGDESGYKVYNHDMWEKELWEHKVEEKMLDALGAEEFKVYIQPKYNPSTNELEGGEALVRWDSPTEGFISPGRFIPIFEKTGFITKLDDYMISHTAALQAKWLQEGKKIVPISINVSRAHFAEPNLAEHIKDLVDQYPLPHEYIEIELTESAFFDDKKALLTTVRKLQSYGFEVSMDDFGAGYSSLNSLKDLPLDVLKLDADFFRGDAFAGRGEIVVSEAISLAKQLNMKIVAEGIEKKEQVDFLAKHKCDMIQGFYFDKPMPADEYVSRMDTTRQEEP